MLRTESCENHAHVSPQIIFDDKCFCSVPDPRRDRRDFRRIILPFLGAILGAIGSFHGSDKVLRLCAMVSTAGWVIHNTWIGSPAAVALESLFLASNFFGFWRFYLRGTYSALDGAKGEH